MSVLIQGMTMPKCCDDCDFIQHGVGDWCYITEKALPCECPLIELPDHGDLIDRDALMKHKGSAYDIDGHELYAVGTGTILRMPVVIPAERREGGEGWKTQ